MAPRHTTGSKPPRDPARNRHYRRPPKETSPRGTSRTSAPAPASAMRRWSPVLGAIIGTILGAGALAAITQTSACGNDAPSPGPTSDTAAPPIDPAPGSAASVPEEASAPVVEEPDPPAQVEAAVEEPWKGPWLGALAHATPIYPTARFSKNRMGYIRKGGTVPVEDKPLKTGSCPQGFYPLVDGGYVCGKYATTQIDDPRVKNGVRAPDLEALLPYQYAYNRAHGTPLYVSIPERERMVEYEPYLAEKKNKGDKEREKEEAERHAEKADQPRAAPDGEKSGDAERNVIPPVGPAGSVTPAVTPTPAPPREEGLQFLTDAGLLATPSAEAEEPELPWWRKDDLTDVKLDDLKEADGVLQKRMVKGFFIAVDKTFGRNDRMWYATTDGLIAPADRMIIPTTPTLKGLDMTAEMKGVGFITWKNGRKYAWAEGDKAPKRGSQIAQYLAVGLTGETKVHDKVRYRETVEGWWFNESQGTYTAAGERPSEVGAEEKWIDVNLSRKTLVAFVGDTPSYAALIAPGKRSAEKAKDHRTSTGKWRIREKHITTTMDGDGPAGDLPYSIQDVPYVMYYDGSFALHGAFWHNNFGREQSHGCVNLAPQDAKHLFMWTEPHLPRGWHGVWSSDKRLGTLVVVHE